MYQASHVSAGGELKFGSGVTIDPATAYGELTTEYAELVAQRGAALNDDARELQIAVDELKGYCSDGWDADGSNAIYQAMIDENQNAWQRFETHYKSIHATRNNPSHLLNTTYRDWQRVVETLQGVDKEIPGLTIDSWQGAAANSYRGQLPAKQASVQESLRLAEASRNGIEAVALLQATILTQLQQSMQHASDAIGNYLAANPVDEPALRNRFKNSYFDFKWNNRAQHSFRFYHRTATVTHYLNWLAGVAGDDLDNTNSGVWVPSSEEIRTYLEGALNGAEAADLPTGDKGTDPTLDRPIDSPTDPGHRMQT